MFKYACVDQVTTFMRDSNSSNNYIFSEITSTEITIDKIPVYRSFFQANKLNKDMPLAITLGMKVLTNHLVCSIRW